MNTSHGVDDTPILSSCRCGDDPKLQLLRDLMNAGMGQLEASRIAFGNDPGPRASAGAWSTWARVEARRLANTVRGRLGLPQLPLVELARR